MRADSAEHVAYRNSRPGKRMGAGALIRDDRGRVLLLEPTYKDVWELPGGAVERDESPRMACEREVTEELGLQLAVGRLFCLEWQGPEPDRTESVMLVFDGGVLPEDAVIQLSADELASYRFVAPQYLEELMGVRLARRTGAAVLAVEEGRLVELEHGVAVEPAAAQRPGSPG